MVEVKHLFQPCLRFNFVDLFLSHLFIFSSIITSLSISVDSAMMSALALLASFIIGEVWDDSIIIQMSDSDRNGNLFGLMLRASTQIFLQMELKL